MSRRSTCRAKARLSRRAGQSMPAGAFPIPESLVGEASLGWEGAQYVGLVAGPAVFPATLASGVVLVGPLDIPLAEGKVTTAPRLLLNSLAPSLVIDRG